MTLLNILLRVDGHPSAGGHGHALIRIRSPANQHRHSRSYGRASPPLPCARPSSADKMWLACPRVSARSRGSAFLGFSFTPPENIPGMQHCLLYLSLYLSLSLFVSFSLSLFSFSLPLFPPLSPPYSFPSLPLSPPLTFPSPLASKSQGSATVTPLRCAGLWCHPYDLQCQINTLQSHRAGYCSVR